MNEPVIRLHGIGKRYRVFRNPADRVLSALGVDRVRFWRKTEFRDHWAVRNVDLVIGRGERVALVGCNGAGKSTLLKIVCGIIAPTEGVAEVRGEIQSLMDLGTAFHPEFTGRQNIRASLAYRGLSDAEIRGCEDDVIEFSELGEFIDQPVRTYSAGMYARLAFSTSTSLKPDVLIIDEVLGAGDAYFNGKCLERIRGLAENHGCTLLFVSHDASAVQALCDRAVWIHQGEVRDDGPTLPVLKKYSAAVREQTDARLRAMDFPAVVLPDRETGDHYGSFAARITDVALFDDAGHDARVLRSGAPAKVVFDYESQVDLREAAFVFCVYLPSGICATQWFAPAAELQIDPRAKRGTVAFDVDELQLGRGKYVASAAIFEEMPRHHFEPRAHHVLDRAVYFEVTNADALDPIDYGVCRHPFRISAHAA